MLAEELNIQKPSVDDIHEVNTDTTWAGVIIICLLKINNLTVGQGWLVYPYPFPKSPLSSNVIQIINGNTDVLLYTLVIYKDIIINFRGIMKVQNGYTC